MTIFEQDFPDSAKRMLNMMEWWARWSRTKILERVWGLNADPMTNVVDVYIRQLRRRIDENHDVKLIKTVRGFGYKVDAS